MTLSTKRLFVVGSMLGAFAFGVGASAPAGATTLLSKTSVQKDFSPRLEAPGTPQPPSIDPIESGRKGGQAAAAKAKVVSRTKAKHAPRGRGVPEFDPSALGAGLTLLAGGVLVMVDRRRRQAVEAK